LERNISPLIFMVHGSRWEGSYCTILQRKVSSS
jgi:hypothetical protein